MQTAFRLIYTLLYILALLFLLPKEYLRRPVNLRKSWLKEKFGIFRAKDNKISKSNRKGRIWIHAVSVGEVLAISGLVRELSKDHDIILSTITDTGNRVAKERFKENFVEVIYLPFDIPWAIDKTIKTLKPALLILTETELWPNLIFISSKKIPVVLVNGRLSEKSFRGYKRIKFFMKDLLKKLKLICVQEEIYRNRFIQIGAEDSKVHVTGNMKFDIKLQEISLPWENLIPRPVVVAGSTHKPEEEIILDAFLQLKTGTLILAPRHPERFDEVERLIHYKISNIRDVLFLKFKEISLPLSKTAKICIILLNQMGVLGSIYRLCDIAIVGGSFIPHGGQNPLEPAYWKKPIICGPYMHNFPFIEEFIENGGCIKTDSFGIRNLLNELLEKPDTLIKMGEKAFETFIKKTGATERTILLLRNLPLSL